MDWTVMVLSACLIMKCEKKSGNEISKSVQLLRLVESKLGEIDGGNINLVLVWF